MSFLPGVLPIYRHLDQISALDVAKYLKVKINPVKLQNIISNKFLYPQVIAVTQLDKSIDLAIMAALFEKYPQYILKESQILLSREYLLLFPNIEDFLTVIIPALDLAETTPIFIKKDQFQVVGTIIRPQIAITTDKAWINGKTFKVKNKQLNFYPAQNKAQTVEIGEISKYQVSGGSLGIIIDLNKKVL